MKVPRTLAVALTTSLFLFSCGGGDGEGFTPELVSLEPASGSQLGGTEVIVTGSRFLSGTPNDVLFGSLAAESVTVLSDTELLVVAPPGAEAGDVDVTVFNSNGFATIGAAYSYVPQPEVMALSPAAGDFKGGETVTIMGSGFQANEAGNVNIVWDGEELDPDRGDYTVLSDTAIEVVTRKGAIFSFADVQVVNGNGTGQGSFEYEGNGLLGMSNFGNSQLVFIDVASGEVLRITQEDDNDNRGARAMVTTAEGKVFAFDRDKGMHEVDVVTGLQTPIGPMTGGTGFKLSAVVGINEQYFAVQGCRGPGGPGGGGALARVDLETRVVTEIGGTQVGDCGGGGGCGAMAANSSGVTYHARRNGSDTDLHTVNLSTGAISGSPTKITNRSSIRSMAFFNDELYGIDRNQREIIKIDPITGFVEVIASFNNDIHSLTSTP
jgi:hypothetical protein